MTATAVPLGLYLHLPFCPARCPYCDFFAQPFRASQALPLAGAMARHMTRWAPAAQGRPLSHVYLGGGTPAMWPARDIALLLDTAQRVWGLAPGAEITVEANPGVLSPGKLRRLRAAGCNRLSLGVQSLQPAMLRALGRRHGADQARRAVEWARTAGFANLSLDFIYGLPHQDRALLLADGRQALELAPEHVSCYQLTLGPDTPFGRRYQDSRPPLPEPGALAGWEAELRQLLEDGGMPRYEVSNFARPGRECRHNQDTWRGGDYLAFGPGAHGHLAGVRWAWAPDVAGYLAAVARGGEPEGWREELTPDQRALELVMLGLRTTRGVDLGALRALGVGRGWLAGPVARLAQLGWARQREGFLVPTALGLDMADAAAALFV